jgi:hypothetical protein
MLNVVKIDSLKIRIPLHKVKYVNSTFASKYQKMYMETGLVDDHINLDQHMADFTDGISSRIAVIHTMQGGIGEKQIAIQCNAKQLRDRYLEGISANTVKDLYDYIIALKIIYVDYSDFLDAYVSDIDICYDVKVTPETMREANQKIYLNVTPTKVKYVSKPFARKDNTGINFNSRDKAVPSLPHVKIYHKTLELESNSLEFAEKHLKGQDIKDIGRLEYTIKNYKHKKRLNIDFTSLSDLLNITAKHLETIIFSGVLVYIDKKTILRNYKDLSPLKMLLLHFIDRDIKNGSDKEAIYASLNIFDNAQERSRMKKQIKYLLENVEDKKRLLANKETLDFLRQIRLEF